MRPSKNETFTSLEAIKPKICTVTYTVSCDNHSVSEKNVTEICELNYFLYPFYILISLECKL